MPLHKLTVFSKDTAADSALKGYEYQKLRTLETWLQNKVDGVDEVIYCEYEDDIFQRDVTAGKNLFRQVKLYMSKNFSFDSVEIKGALSNFFMLYVKGEYSFDQVAFVFESNSAIARNYSGNDADLLTEWFEHQQNLEGDLLKRCAAKLKAVLTEYVTKEFKAQQKVDEATAEEAKALFDSLPDEVWEDFARTIEWSFDDVDANTAVERTVNNIQRLILELPFPSAMAKPETVFTTLYYEVSERMFQEAPEDRCLTTARLDSLILDLGEDADKQYNNTYNAWTGIAVVEDFNTAEFFEVLHAANHCRWKSYLVAHSAFWSDLLQSYINAPSTPEYYRVKALYEYLWLQLRPTLTKGAQGTLEGQEEAIRQYFSLAFAYIAHENIADHLALLQIVRAAILQKRCTLALDETDQWYKRITEIVTVRAAATANANERCYWLDLHAQLLMYPENPAAGIKNIGHVQAIFDEIIRLIPEAPQYNVTSLSERTNQIIGLFLSVKTDFGMVSQLEDLADKLIPFVSQRNGNHLTAKTLVSRGVKYLQTTDPHYMGKALQLFHRAKDLWKQAETVEGHVLALLNIGQLYLALKMNLAARYYIMSAAWMAMNQDRPKLAKRISSAYGLLVYCDFMQGAWMNALTSFSNYVQLRNEFDPRPVQDDLLFAKSFAKEAFILYYTPLIAPQLTVFIDAQKAVLGALYTDILEPLCVALADVVKDKPDEQVIGRELSGIPLNDIGPTRPISFRAFGSLWKVIFPNTCRANALGEEFVAILQILLTELSYSSLDLHLVRTTVEIEIVEGGLFTTPEQLPSNDHFKWKVYTDYTDVNEEQPVRLHMASLLSSLQYILCEVSLLKQDGFNKHVEGLFRSEGLADKTLPVTLYQRIYRRLFSQQEFDISARDRFNAVPVQFELREDPILHWNDTPSPLYSKEESLKQIEGRLTNCLRQLPLTLAHLKTQEGYQQFIDDLRAKGWLDWQIVLAMFNHVLSFKANRLINNRTFGTEHEYVEALQTAFAKVLEMEEKDMLIHFPLSHFTDPGLGFELALDQTTHIVLETWGLESRSAFPNFPALREFLNKRFNFGTDDIPGISPL